MKITVRLFAIQRQLAGARDVALDVESGATIGDAWTGLVAIHPLLAPGLTFVRFARNGAYADQSTPLNDGDEVAIIPPVSGGAPHEPAGTPRAETRILEIRPAAFGAEILGELADRLATTGDGAVAAFLGRTRSTPGTPAPGQEAEAARHADRAVESLDYEAHESMALDVLATIADEVAERFGVERVAIVHRVGTVPLGAASIAIVAVSAHRDAAFAAARYAIEEVKARAPIWKAERFDGGQVWIGQVARTGAVPD